MNISLGTGEPAEASQVLVYLAGSIVGGRAYAGAYRAIARHLAAESAVLLSSQVLDPVGVDGGMTDEQIYDRDVEALARADCLIAEVSQPSIGVGFEIAYALGLSKPVLALYDAVTTNRVSAMVAGCKQVRTVPYDDESTMGTAVREFIRAL